MTRVGETGPDRIAAVRSLLARTEAAHGEYETAELNGVYDQDWARWYAAYAVDHGISGVLGRDVTADDLAVFLARTWDELQQADPPTSEPWPAYAGRRIAEEL
jgi:hypothetical protein